MKQTLVLIAVVLIINAVYNLQYMDSCIGGIIGAIILSTIIYQKKKR